MKFHYLLIILSLSLCSCATILSKSTYPVSIRTNPIKTEIIIKDSEGDIVYSGFTPVTIPLKAGKKYFKRERYTIICKKNGFETKEIKLRNKVTSSYWLGNPTSLIFSPIGLFIIDPLTGAMYKLDKNIYINLKSNDYSSNTLQIKSIDEIPLKDRKHLIKVTN